MLKERVPDLWEAAQKDIWDDWMRETDPVNLQPRVRPPDPEKSPIACCGRQSIASRSQGRRGSGPYSLKPLRQRERASVGYAFSQRASALSVREAA